MEYTLYRIVDRKADHERVIMYMTDMNGERSDRFWDFGYANVFDVARTLEVWEERTFKIEGISKTDFVRRFGYW